MLSEEDETLFNESFELIRTEITKFTEKFGSSFSESIDELIAYNVPGGKNIRAKIVVAAHNILCEEMQCDEEKRLQVRVVGWCIELLQLAGLISDDLMDSGTTRRGRECWYRLHPKMAPVHVVILRSLPFYLLRQYCGNKKNYKQIIELFVDTEWKMLLGETMDMLSSVSSKINKAPFRDFTHNHFDMTAKLKGSSYTTVLPVRLALYLSNIDDEETHAIAKRILLRIGVLFQAQDDYLDIYGSVAKTGKVGTDIQDGKCTWMAVEAMTRMNNKQLAIYKSNYGVNNDEAIKTVLKIYEALDMKRVFEEFETKEYDSIIGDIEGIQSQYPKLCTIIGVIAKIIAKRKQ